MKKIIGIILAILFFVSFWIGLSFTFYFGGMNLTWSIIMPLCCYVATALLVGLVSLIGWLLN